MRAKMAPLKIALRFSLFMKVKNVGVRDILGLRNSITCVNGRRL